MMKISVRLCFSAVALVCAFVLGSCSVPPSPGEPWGGFGGAPAPSATKAAYKDGYRDGFDDASRGLTAEVLRHGAAYQRPGREAEYRAYCDGYSRGYGEGRPSGGGHAGEVQAAFNRGEADGRSDASRGLPAEALRHGSAYHRPGREAEYEAYCRGYSKGYGAVHHAGQGGGGEGLSAREQGYADGRLDAQRHLSADPSRHPGSHNNAPGVDGLGYQIAYRKAYREGFDSVARHR